MLQVTIYVTTVTVVDICSNNHSKLSRIVDCNLCCYYLSNFTS
nr:MAG TPA: hypothetical protein [Caudoviricetes sp.]